MSVYSNGAWRVAGESNPDRPLKKGRHAFRYASDA